MTEKVNGLNNAPVENPIEMGSSFLMTGFKTKVIAILVTIQLSQRLMLRKKSKVRGLFFLLQNLLRLSILRLCMPALRGIAAIIS